MRTKEEINRIREYTRCYHYPISDLKGFNKILKNEGIKPVRCKTIKKLLDY